MGLGGIFAELRHRGVLKVATVYLGFGVVVLEVGTHLLHNFEAPHWALKVFSTLVILGFPLSCLMAWALDITEEGKRAPPPAPRRTDALFAVSLAIIFLVVTATAVRRWSHPAEEVLVPTAAELQQPAEPATRPATGPQVATAAGKVPVVIIMDTPAPRGVYETETRDKGGTNADDLNDLLRDLPINIRKESIGAIWEREVQIVSQEPELVLVHRSGFFHAMNQEFGFGYPEDGAGFDEVAVRRLYELSDNKLVAVLGFLGRDNPRTRFLVYSRGTGGGWTDDQYRAEWVHKVEGRFPFLKGRIGTVNVPGGPGGGSFDDADTRQLFRRQVQELLGLAAAEPAAKAPATR